MRHGHGFVLQPGVVFEIEEGAADGRPFSPVVAAPQSRLQPLVGVWLTLQLVSGPAGRLRAGWLSFCCFWLTAAGVFLAAVKVVDFGHGFGPVVFVELGHRLVEFAVASLFQV